MPLPTANLSLANLTALVGMAPTKPATGSPPYNKTAKLVMTVEVETVQVRECEGGRPLAAAHRYPHYPVVGRSVEVVDGDRGSGAGARRRSSAASSIAGAFTDSNSCSAAVLGSSVGSSSAPGERGGVADSVVAESENEGEGEWEVVRLADRVGKMQLVDGDDGASQVTDLMSLLSSASVCSAGSGVSAVSRAGSVKRKGKFTSQPR